jgi:hypothetical protein
VSRKGQEKTWLPSFVISDCSFEMVMPTLPGDQGTPRDQLFAIAGLEAGSVFKG